MKTEILKSHYDTQFSLYDDFRKSVLDQILRLLEKNNVILATPLQSRIKTFKSILGKIERGGAEIHSLHHVLDLVGLRVILLFKKDLDKVQDIISKNFIVVGAEDTSNRLNQDQFGYGSLHYQINLSPEWLKLPTLSEFDGLTAEIQVRTGAQHIWAAASHELQYKNEKNVPAMVRRSIHRVSALLETVDLELVRVLEEREKYLSSVNTASRDQVLDVELLSKYMSEFLPSKNRRDGEEAAYSELLADLAHVSITNLGQLSDLWEKFGELSIKADAELAEKISSDEKDPRNSERIENGVYLAQVGLIRQAITFAKRITFGKLIEPKDIDPSQMKPLLRNRNEEVD